MATERVEVTRDLARRAESVWAVAREFCSDWHPAITRVWSERAANGGLIRCFETPHDNTLYREQLTAFSDSDRCFRYTLLDGITGIDSYSAHFAVVTTGEATCRVSWCADIAGPAQRIVPVAKGTAAIFRAGIETLAAVEGYPAHTERTGCKLSDDREEVIIAGDPELALSVSSASNGPVCLFLHGIGGNRSNWSPQFALHHDALRIASLDLRGYGDSTLGHSQSRVGDYCDDILRVRDALGTEKVVLCGLSYGAWIATAFAHRHPDALHGLVLCGGCTGMSEASVDEQARFRTSREAPLDAGQVPADFAPAVVDVIAGPGADSAVREVLRASMAAIPAATYRDAINCFTQPEEQFDFAPLDLPVMLLTGEHDRLAPPEEIRAVAQRIHAAVDMPNVRFEVISGAGHVCNLEQPNTVNRLLAEFVGAIVA